MEKLKDKKPEQTQPWLLETEVCSDFRLYQGGSQVSAHSMQILQLNSVPMQRLATDFDGHPARHAPPCRVLALADRAPSIPEIASLIVFTCLCCAW